MRDHEIVILQWLGPAGGVGSSWQSRTIEEIIDPNRGLFKSFDGGKAHRLTKLEEVLEDD